MVKGECDVHRLSIKDMMPVRGTLLKVTKPGLFPRQRAKLLQESRLKPY